MDANVIRQSFLERAFDAERLGDAAAAAVYLEQALALDSNSAVFWSWLGQCYSACEQYAAASHAFEQALALEPEYAPACSGLASVLEAVGRYVDAEEWFRRATLIGPTSARFVLLGDVQSRLFRDSEAEASFREALRLDPENEEAMFNLGILIRDERPAEAEALLRAAIQRDPTFAAGRRELGYELARRGLYGAAQDELRTAMMLDSADPWTRIYMASVLWSQGEAEMAEAELVQACELSPRWSVPHWLLGIMYDHTGRTHLAEDALRTAVDLDPQDPNAAYHLGRYLLDFGFRDEGRQWIARTLDLEPNHKRARAVSEKLDVW